MFVRNPPKINISLFRFEIYYFQVKPSLLTNCYLNFANPALLSDSTVLCAHFLSCLTSLTLRLLLTHSVIQPTNLTVLEDDCPGGLAVPAHLVLLLTKV